MSEKFNIENYNFALDIPDTRDYTHEDVYGDGETGGDAQIPTSVILDLAPNLNQGNVGACTVFGSTNAYNETFAQACDKAGKPYDQPYSPWTAWEECLRRGASDSTGWIFQGALQVLRDLHCIGGYVMLRVGTMANVDLMRQVIASGKAIATGVATADWTEIIKTGEYAKTTKLGGHIFDITGYDDNHWFSDGRIGGFFIKNSWGNTGEFWLSYDDVDALYSTYEFALTGELDEYVKNRRNEFLQKAYDRGIWNESEGDRLATESEIRIMLNRALGIEDSYHIMRKTLFDIYNEFIVRDKILMIWNGERPYELARDRETAIMFTRAVMRNTKIDDLTLSRRQVAEIIGRDFL